MWLWVCQLTEHRFAHYLFPLRSSFQYLPCIYSICSRSCSFIIILKQNSGVQVSPALLYNFTAFAADAFCFPPCRQKYRQEFLPLIPPHHPSMRQVCRRTCRLPLQHNYTWQCWGHQGPLSRTNQEYWQWKQLNHFRQLWKHHQTFQLFYPWYQSGEGQEQWFHRMVGLRMFRWYEETTLRALRVIAHRPLHLSWLSSWPCFHVWWKVW